MGLPILLGVSVAAAVLSACDEESESKNGKGPAEGVGEGEGEGVVIGEGEGEGAVGEGEGAVIGEGEGEGTVGEGEGAVIGEGEGEGAVGEGEGEDEREPLRADINIDPSNTLAIYATQFGSGEGEFKRIDLEERLPQTVARLFSADVVLKRGGPHLFLLDRTNGRVHRYNADFEEKTVIDVGAGTNPQDIVMTREGLDALEEPVHEAVISRLAPQFHPNNLDDDPDNDDHDDLVFVNPVLGTVLGGVNLTPLTDPVGDRLPYAYKMIPMEGETWVLMQQLSSDFQAVRAGTIAVIDNESKAVKDVDPNRPGTQLIPLSCWNPADITFSEQLGKVLVSCTGVYNADWSIDLNTPYGGIETLDPNTYRTNGIVLDDLDFARRAVNFNAEEYQAGAVSALRLFSADLGFVVTDAKVIASFNPSTMTVLNKKVFSDPSVGFIGDFTIDQGGRLWIAAKGLTVWDPEGAEATSIGLDPSATALAFVKD